MMQHPVIIYPQPPPTCNVLTSSQRQQLLRTTKKLAKVLGSTPQLIDCNYSQPVHVDLSTKSRLTRSHSRKSSSVSSHSHHQPPSPTSTISTKSSSSYAPPRTPHGPRAKHQHHSPSSSTDSQESLHHQSRRPPLLRLAVNVDSPFGSANAKRSTNTTSPTSPSYSSSSSSPSSPSSATSFTNHLLLASSPSSRSYSIPVPRTRRPSSIILQTEAQPQFLVSSEASLRRKKMERVRKRLGECVPIEALFHDDEEHDDNGDHRRRSSDSIDTSDHRSNFAAGRTSLEAVYEYPDEHGDEWMGSGFGHTSRPSTANSGSKSWGRRICKAMKIASL